MTRIVFQNYMNKINHEIALLVKILNLSTYKHKDQIGVAISAQVSSISILGWAIQSLDNKKYQNYWAIGNNIYQNLINSS